MQSSVSVQRFAGEGVKLVVTTPSCQTEHHTNRIGDDGACAPANALVHY